MWKSRGVCRSFPHPFVEIFDGTSPQVCRSFPHLDSHRIAGRPFLRIPSQADCAEIRLHPTHHLAKMIIDMHNRLVSNSTLNWKPNLQSERVRDGKDCVLYLRSPVYNSECHTRGYSSLSLMRRQEAVSTCADARRTEPVCSLTSSTPSRAVCGREPYLGQ